MSNRFAEGYRETFLDETVADLTFVIVFAVMGAVVLVALATTHPLLRYTVAAPLFVFLPGYALVAAIFPQNQELMAQTETTVDPFYRSLTPLERVAFSIGVSVTSVPLAGLVLNVILGGITMLTVTVTVAGLTVISAIIAGERRLALPTEKRYRVPYRRWIDAVIRPDNRSEHAANAVLLVSLVVMLGTFGYTTAVPSESFTELGVLTNDESGELTADNYPSELTRGESATFELVVTNHEGHDQRYTVVVQVHRVGPQHRNVLDTRELRRFQFDVASGGTWHRAHVFTPRVSGNNLRVAYLLYRGDAPSNPRTATAYRRVHVWINVSG